MNRFSGAISIAVCAFLASNSSFAAWKLGKDGTDLSSEYITDGEHEFRLDEMSCGVGPTEFLRAPDDSIMEHRELYCWVSSDTKVSITANCNFPLYGLSSIGIDRAGKSYAPMLICGPKK